MLPIYLARLNSEEDRRRFEEIYLRYRRQMFTVARSYLPNDADAEDAVHDVFLRVASSCWETVCRIDDGTDLRNYLMKAVKHMAINIRNRKGAGDLSLDDGLEETDLGGRLRDETFAAAVEQIEERELLEAIKALPELYRDALYFRYVLQLSIAETAQATGQSVSATKKQIQRGRRKLMVLLGK